MPRALFEKIGNSAYISHLDLMRLFQRAFKRAGLPLTHTQGFNPRPSVSIALPLSLGVESHCELLDFDLTGDSVSCEEIKERLNSALVDGVRVLQVYEGGSKIKNLSMLDCTINLEYDNGIPADGLRRLSDFFTAQNIVVEKSGKNGTVQQDIAPMIYSLNVNACDANIICLEARIACQNPSLNPIQIVAAIRKYLPDLTPDYAHFCRQEIYQADGTVFR
ncbi:MAG: DUF2344 domain-containing protein [Ruminococcaceae bacterium]|nr:DUF2344 domain-containing protein [Oscillospiraceae bacterium]